jgi:hypothetical protein
LILVISNVANDAANDLVGMFPAGAASLVTASNLNESFRAGVSVGDFPASEIEIGGATIPAGKIAGVVSTVSHFLPQEFYYIEPADREYVCAEVSAFFIYFLSELGCRKLNPPSARRLSGLGMHRIEWTKAARSLGVPPWPVRLRNGAPVAAGDTAGVTFRQSTIVGGRIVGEGSPERIVEYMRILSRAFSMPYLSCVFATPGGDDYFLADLASVPDIATPANREAIVGFLA